MKSGGPHGRVHARTVAFPRFRFRQPMNIAGVLLVVLALVAAERPIFPVGSSPAPWVTVCLGMTFVVLLAILIASAVAGLIRLRPHGVHTWLRGYAILRHVHASAWFLVSATCLFALQWPAAIRSQFAAVSFPFAAELLILLPVMAPLSLSYAAFYSVEQATANAFDGGTRRETSFGGRWQFAWWHMRHGFGLVLCPILAVVLIHDLLGPNLETVSWWLSFAIVLGLITCYPRLVACVWQTSPIRSGRLLAQVGSTLGPVSGSSCRLREWHTGGRILNAFVAGPSARRPTVLISDALLRHFTAEETMAVVRHELSHAARRHVVIRLLALAPPVMALSVAWTAAPDSAVKAEFGALSATVPIGGLATVVASIGYLWCGFGHICRTLEHEADLESCRQREGEPADGENRAWRPDLEAIEASQRALAKLGAVHGDRVRSWLHPTIDQRIQLLSVAAANPGMASHLSRRIRVYVRILAVTMSALLVVFAAAAWRGP